ncbi:hypothetical protein ACJMK2_020730 [Sinanodonta woodiana]|uniref:MYG1 n=2 Tax=Sinanodonta woodiana TaxID=1069815 RepID=A0ABD3U114_SINWO
MLRKSNIKRTGYQFVARVMSSSVQKIGTHNGHFHCDEVLACFLLKQLPKYQNAEIVRSRDPAVLDACDIVVDVGGVFDAARNRFDHHQRTFNESMNSLCPSKKWVTKLSSAGLVYLYFGREIISKFLETETDDPQTEIIYDKMYEHFVEAIDAIDNGISQYDGEPRYIISTNLSNRVAFCNPTWNEKNADEQECFLKAVKLVGEEFLSRLMFYKNSWLPARELVKKAIDKREQIDSSGEIIVLTEGGCPWKDHLFAVEEEEEISPLIKYVLYTDQSGKWRVQCVPVSLNGFENRLSLSKEWCGLRDAELSEKSGIPGCIFVHANGFIGGNETYEGALQMARWNIRQYAESS